MGNRTNIETAIFAFAGHATGKDHPAGDDRGALRRVDVVTFDAVGDAREPQSFAQLRQRLFVLGGIGLVLSPHHLQAFQRVLLRQRD